METHVNQLSSSSNQSLWRKTWFRALASLLALVVMAVAVFFAGPRNQFGPNTPTARAQAPQDITALDTWLRNSEAAFPDIKPGNAKGIAWAGAPGQRTPWSVVYIHGFSASRLETAPLTDLVAKALGANVFYTRLTGHGRPGAAMGEATAQDWLADAQEALQIGRTLGARVLIISCSTGSTLATWLATNGETRQVAGHVFVSPNFGPKDKRAEIINGPWGHKIAYAIQGDIRGGPPDSQAEGGAWTSSYPTRGLFPMMALVKAVRDSDLSTFQTPVLVLYSEKDETVDPAETQAAFTRIGAPLKSIEVVNYSDSKGQHVLAGNIRAPNATAPMAATIVKWVQSLPVQAP
jgi:esterase/lipase